MDSVVVDRIVEILEDDAFRRGGTVTLDRVLALATKHRLSPADIILVKQRLHARDVEIEKPKAEDDSPEPKDDELPLVSGENDVEYVVSPSSDEETRDEVRDILAAYFRDAAKFRLLTPQEELALARRIHTGRAAAERLAISATEHMIELRALAEEGERARKALVEANLLLVPFVAKRINNRGFLTQEDLIQEGNLGLLRAAEKFDDSHGTRFSTYACWWIWSSMKRAVIDRGRLVRLPVHIADRIPLLLRTRAALARERDGAQPSAQELPFPGFSSAYYLTSTGSNRPFHADVEMTREQAFGLTRAEMTLPEPVPARWFMGSKKPGDIIWTTFSVSLMVSDRVVDLLRDVGFTGWRTYAVDLVGHDGAPIPGYHGLAIHGRCGPIDDSKSVQVPKQFPGGMFPVWTGMYFDPDTWDGSDLFMSEDGKGSKFVVEDVKRAFQKAKIRNVQFERLDEVERSMLP